MSNSTHFVNTKTDHCNQLIGQNQQIGQNRPIGKNRLIGQSANRPKSENWFGHSSRPIGQPIGSVNHDGQYEQMTNCPLTMVVFFFITNKQQTTNSKQGLRGLFG